jgi:hypothetical protein
MTEPTRPRGRPKGKTHPHQINIYMSDDDVAVVDRARGGDSRSKYVRRSAVDRARRSEKRR